MNVHSDQISGLNLPRPATDEYESGNLEASSTPSAVVREDFSASVGHQEGINPSFLDDEHLQQGGSSQTDYEGVVANDEWIVKAEDIIRRTQADPYAQSREISRLKAEYIRARYNKGVKVAEG